MSPLKRQRRDERPLTREEQSENLLLRRRQQKRKRIAGFVALGILGAALLTAQVTGETGKALTALDKGSEKLLIDAGVTVESIQVIGRVKTDPDALRAALDVARGESLLHVDLDAMRKRVEAIGWVKSANLYRRLPNRLVLKIEERQAFAVWQYEGKLQVIDRDGTVIVPASLGNFSSLPLIVGKGAPDDAAELERMLAAEPALARKVAAAVRVGDRRWNIRFKNGVEAQLPQDDPEDAWGKLAKLEADHGVLERDIVHVDLRLKDRLVIREKDAPINLKPKGPRI
jgi:cell division protein FtsQ